ncbi:MAG TPA: hypothetical protein VGE21_06150 [Flavobacteriales bacterium]
MRHLLTLPVLLLCGTASAQVDCDSVRVDSIRYAPFGDGLQISLFNQNTHFLSGPTVDVWNANGDTLGQGYLEFFVLFEGPSLHQVHFTPQPPSPFTGTVVLHYNDGEGEAQCELSVDALDLCPPAGCVPVEVFAYQQGGNPVAMDLPWSVTDTDKTVMASGVLQMDGSGFGFATTGICLLPGAYTLHMTQPEPAGTSIQVGMTQLGFAYTDGLTVPLPIGGSVDLPFDYYLLCADGTQSIVPSTMEAPTLIVDGSMLHITSNAPLGNLTVIDALGRTVHRLSSLGTRASVDLGGSSKGTYLLCSENRNWPTQRFVLR